MGEQQTEDWFEVLCANYWEVIIEFQSLNLICSISAAFISQIEFYCENTVKILSR